MSKMKDMARRMRLVCLDCGAVQPTEAARRRHRHSTECTVKMLELHCPDCQLQGKTRAELEWHHASGECQLLIEQG